jgi:23S rRNA (cytidine1920-2'-O)/16S rRNA (cytidine1409-2'-O)-methyltransferase
VSRRLAADVASAHELIALGRVLVGNAPTTNPRRLVAPGEPVRVEEVVARQSYPSRAGHKLAAALDRFEVEVKARRCLDAGAANGGFTACLIARGAAQVVAVDVGYGLLDDSLRNDPRVTVMERTNVRFLCASTTKLGAGFQVVVADLSFVSLAKLVPYLAGSLAAPDADLVLLVKPQFEADHATVSAGKGVIRDPAVWEESLVKVGSALMSQGSSIMGAMASPLPGAKGNVEFFIHAVAHRPGQTSLQALLGLVGPAVDEGIGLVDLRAGQGVER